MCKSVYESEGKKEKEKLFFHQIFSCSTNTFEISSPKGLSLLFLSIPTCFPPHSLWFSSGWNRTWSLIISQTPPSLWLAVFLFPPSCAESLTVSINPGLSCPAVCIPLLLGEHGTAPGPLCSHRREVNVWERARERERATTLLHLRAPTASSPLTAFIYFVSLEITFEYYLTLLLFHL